MIHPQFCEAIIKKIRERQIPLASNLGSGGCGSYEEYRALCGQIYGLKQAEEIVTEIYNASMNMKNMRTGDIVHLSADTDF